MVSPIKSSMNLDSVLRLSSALYFCETNVLPTALTGLLRQCVFSSRILFYSSLYVLFLSLTVHIILLKSLSTGLPPWPLCLAPLPSLCCNLTGFSLCLEYVTFTPNSGPLQCCFLCQGSSQSPLSTTQIPIPVSPPPRDPPCQSVSNTHSPFSTPGFLSSSCLAVLNRIPFFLVLLLSISLTSECHTFKNKVLSCSPSCPPST